MTRYQVFNAQWQPIPVNPFETVEDARRHVWTLLETYTGPFYVVELKIVAVIK